MSIMIETPPRNYPVAECSGRRSPGEIIGALGNLVLAVSLLVFNPGCEDAAATDAVCGVVGDMQANGSCDSPYPSSPSTP